MAKPRICLIPNCGKRIHGRGWCKAHWTRWARHGSPLGGGPSPTKTPIKTPTGKPQQFYYETVLTYREDDCLIWPFGRSRDGYGVLTIAAVRRQVHRFACEAAHGAPASSDLEVAHSCGNGNKGCCNPQHLRWATQTENQADRFLHGTDSRGEKNGAAKLTADQVRVIRDLVRKGETYGSVAERFPVCAGTIGDIARRKKWAWLE